MGIKIWRDHSLLIPLYRVRDSLHKVVRRLTAKSREVLWPREWMLYWSYRSEIWQAFRQRCCRGAYQISKRLEKSKPQSRCFETSRDLAVRRPYAWWIEALETVTRDDYLLDEMKKEWPVLIRHLHGLTHWGRVTHKSVSKLTIIASDNDLSPGRHQAIIWTSAGVLLIVHLGTNFSEILIEIITFSFKKMRLKSVCEVASILSRPQCVKSPQVTTKGLRHKTRDGHFTHLLTLTVSYNLNIFIYNNICVLNDAQVIWLMYSGQDR